MKSGISLVVKLKISNLSSRVRFPYPAPTFPPVILIYTTLNNSQEATNIGKKSLKANLANCVNFFPITCIYNYQDQITQEPEVVLIIKTLDSKFSQVEKLIKKEISYDNFIGQLKVTNVNSNFESGLPAL